MKTKWFWASLILLIVCNVWSGFTLAHNSEDFAFSVLILLGILAQSSAFIAIIVSEIERERTIHVLGVLSEIEKVPKQATSNRESKNGTKK